MHRKRVRLWFVLVAFMAAVGCGETEPTAATQDSSTVRRIVVLGDSLAVSPAPATSFPAVLQQMITSRRLPWTVTNAGISGDTTEGGRRRVTALLEPDVGILVLALGANDGLGGVAVPTVEANLAEIIEQAKSRGVQVLLCGMETLPTHGIGYTFAFHDIFPRLAQQKNVPLVPFLLAGVALDPALNGPDRLHPNEAGARRIAEGVWPHLEPLLR